MTARRPFGWLDAISSSTSVPREGQTVTRARRAAVRPHCKRRALWSHFLSLVGRAHAKRLP